MVCEANDLTQHALGQGFGLDLAAQAEQVHHRVGAQRFTAVVGDVAGVIRDQDQHLAWHEGALRQGPVRRFRGHEVGLPSLGLEQVRRQALAWQVPGRRVRG